MLGSPDPSRFWTEGLLLKTRDLRSVTMHGSGDPCTARHKVRLRLVRSQFVFVSQNWQIRSERGAIRSERTQIHSPSVQIRSLRSQIRLFPWFTTPSRGPACCALNHKVRPWQGIASLIGRYGVGRKKNEVRKSTGSSNPRPFGQLTLSRPNGPVRMLILNIPLAFHFKKVTIPKLWLIQ